jgi:preprotein translocase subunit SecA
MQSLGMEEDAPIASNLVTRAIENAQRKVEGRNFEIRKQLLQYDDVANDQRKVIYHQRAELMAQDNISEMINAMRESVIAQVVDSHIPPNSMEEQWNTPALEQQLAHDFALKLNLMEWLNQDDSIHEEGLRQRIYEEIETNRRNKEVMLGKDTMRNLEKSIMLQTLDYQWREHLAAMDHLRQGIHLRGYAQKDPKQEYKREAFQLFSSMLDNIKHDVISLLCTVQIREQEDVEAVERQRREEAPTQMQFQHAQFPALANEGEDEPAVLAEAPLPFMREEPKVGRNDPCPCGSGKKFKQCHGRVT